MPIPGSSSCGFKVCYFDRDLKSWIFSKPGGSCHQFVFQSKYISSYTLGHRFMIWATSQLQPFIVGVGFIIRLPDKRGFSGISCLCRQEPMFYILRIIRIPVAL
jgi:hypothetical protein